MRKILARTLVNHQTNDLFEILNGSFILVFDNGEEVETNAKETLYSSFAWEFHREYPNTPILPHHHINRIIGGGVFGSNTHLQLVGNCMWSVHDTYVGSLPNVPNAEIRFRDKLSKRVYELVNLMYNELTTKLERYVISLDIIDFIGVLNHPEIKHANNTIEPTQASINDTYNVIKNALSNSPELTNNPIALAVRGKLANIDQVLQCVSARGFITDTDSVLFPQPIIRGYAQGLRAFHDSFIESRSAAKSLIFSKTPLQQAEYFSRRLQLMSQIVQRLHLEDCGSKEYTLWHVRGAVINNKDGSQSLDKVATKELFNISGKNYIQPDGSLKTIKPTDYHLVGKAIKLRTVIHCGHKDQYGVCAACFGELSYSIPENSNLGQMCCTSLAQKSSQNVLSVKHLDGSSVVDSVVLTDHQKLFLSVGSEGNSYLMSNNLNGKVVKLIIPHSEASNISDIMEVSDVKELNITRVSEISEIGIMVDGKIESFTVKINQRLASMTYPLLDYIKQSYWVIDERGNYVIDLAGWDWTKEILILPLRHFNMSDHSRDIATFLESSIDKLKERDQNTSPNTALVELFDLVNTKLSVNLAVLEVVLYASMVVSAEDNDFSLPKNFTKRGLGVMKLSMANRSLSAAMAYEDHRKQIISPYSYINTNRTDHIFDRLLCYHD